MSDVYITLDAGSCHMGQKTFALQMISQANFVGADAIKFQMGVSEPNIDLPREWWPELCAHAADVEIDIYSSIFNTTTLAWYLENHPDSAPRIIKFAHSQRANYWQMKQAKKAGFTIFASCDCMSDALLAHLADVRLFCISEYPLMWNPRLEGIFPRFHGFSDHSLGSDIAEFAVASGAEYIEKHFKLDISRCPDANFALTPGEAEGMINMIRALP